MPNLIKLLNPNEDKEVTTGEIVQCKPDGVYQVKIGTRTLPVRSLVSERLSKNSQVVVVQTNRGLYIINKDYVKDRQIVEVVIDG